MSASGVVAGSARPRILSGWQIAVLLLLVLVLVAAIYAGTRTKADVRVTNPTYQDIESTVASTGTVVPVQDFPARANFTGLVEKIYVKLGQKVHAGQMLIQMKDQYADSRLDAARAALDEAEMNQENVMQNGSQEDKITFAADLERAKAEQAQAAGNYESLQKLLKNGSVSQAEVDAAKQRLDTANANLRTLNERTSNRYSAKDLASWKDRVRANRETVEAEKVSWANANISSPVSGTVYLLGAKLYDFVPAGTDLLHVADLSKLHIRAEFDEADLGKLQVGQPVRITWDGAPNRSWNGRIESKPLAVTQSGARTVGQCTIQIEDDKGDLPVNTTVALTVVIEKRAHVLSIPREAMYTEGAEHYVYRVVDGKLVKTPVRPGLASAMYVEITQGLKPDDVVALHPLNDGRLAPDLRVKAIR